MTFSPVKYYPALAAGAALAFALAYSSLFGMVLSESAGSGLRYSVIAAFGSLGWAAGGAVGGALYHSLGSKGLIGSAVLVAAGYVAAYVFYREPRGGYERPPGPREVARGLSAVAFVAASVGLGWAALTVFYGAMSIRLSEEIESDILYGVTLTTIPAVLGFLARPIAGVASDYMGSERLLAASNAAYAVVFGLAASLKGPALIVLWAIPLYPFRDVASSLSVSSRLPPSLQATAAGVLSFASSAAGLLAAWLGLAFELDILEAMTIASALMLAANISLIADEIVMGRRREPCPQRPPSQGL
jgi:hypothetical protein